MSQISGESVVAESGTQFDFDFLALPGNRRGWVPKWGFKTEAPTFDPRFDIGGQLGGWHYGVKAYGGYGGDVGSDGEAKRGPDVNEYCDFAGVFGTGIYVTGVAGTSVNNVGVYGQAGETSDSISGGLVAGVIGASSTSRGVIGLSTNDYGVTGYGNNRAGVYGYSYASPGIFGLSGSGVASGIIGWCDGEGPQVPNTPNIAGVLGTSVGQHGVIGTSNANVGVIGFSTKNYGVLGYTSNPASYAGYFLGNLLVTGQIFAGTKDAIVPFPDGSKRLLHCMESPEHWFEDFGTAKLKRGRAVVKLDADFGKVIKRGDYHVFFTPRGDCRGLYVRSQGGASFEVRELTGGKSSVAFSYRIVGCRKDIRGHKRFAKIDPRLQLPAAATRAARKRAPTAAEFHKFVARVKTEAREMRPKGARKGGRPRALPKGMKRALIMRTPR
jgi:hypothetical protein